MTYVPARDLTRAIRTRFEQTYLRPPEYVGRAPGRVNVIGEHTDYNDGPCLPMALRHSAWAAWSPRPDGELRVHSPQAGSWQGTLGDLAPQSVEGWAGYVTGALWSATTAGLVIPGGDLLLDSDVPLGGGLSSSAALIGAVLMAVAGELPREQLVDLAIAAESQGVGAPTGGLDQTASLLAEPAHALLVDFGTSERRQVPWRAADAGLTLLVVDSHVSHQHADGGYRQRREESAAALAAAGRTSYSGLGVGEVLLDDPVLARRARHVVTESERVREVTALLENDDWAGVGAALTASHASLRDDYEVSVPELDATVQAVLDDGALGARMVGGGFGGSAVVLTDRPDTHVTSLRRLYADRGWPEPSFLLAEASGGAERV